MCIIGIMRSCGRPRKQHEIRTHKVPDRNEEENEKFEGESSHPLAGMNLEEKLLAKIAQSLATELGLAQRDFEENYGIERLKALGATTFIGTTDPADAEA